MEVAALKVALKKVSEFHDDTVRDLANAMNELHTLAALPREATGVSEAVVGGWIGEATAQANANAGTSSAHSAMVVRRVLTARINAHLTAALDAGRTP